MAPRASERLLQPRVAQLSTSPNDNVNSVRSLSLLSGHGNEADDERSSFSSSAYSSMGPGIEESLEMDPPPAYAGEDTRPTSKKELLGFYAYSFAGEVFAVCALGAFIPITLEELARASPTAVLASDHSIPCIPNGTAKALLSRVADKTEGTQCVFNFLGTDINTASFAMYTFSVSVLLQAFVVVTMSGAADHGKYRKTLMMTFAVVGAIATMLFLPVVPSVVFLGSLWAIVGNVCFGASFVLLNSFLPVLVRNHPEVRHADLDKYEAVPVDEEEPPTDQEFDHSNEAVTSDVVDADSDAALLPHTQRASSFLTPPSALSIEMQVSTRTSAYAVGIGYSAAVLVQLLSLVILKSTGSSLFSLRLVLFVVGLWWICFTVPAAFCLRPRPGPPLSLAHSESSFWWLGYLTYSWKNLYRTILRARRLRDVLLFLAAWFMISDAIATVSGTAILFAKTTLGMTPSALALINVIVTLSGIVGALTWSKIGGLMRWKPSQTILTCICLFELIPLYGLLGYIPAIQRLGMFGLQQQWEMYPLGAVYGLVLGGLSSYCRSLFGELIPPGSEAAFYALYAITDKGSSIFGPVVVGAITDATGDIRPAFWFLAVLIALPIPLMFLVDVERGKLEGTKLARETLSIADDSVDLNRESHSDPRLND